MKNTTFNRPRFTCRLVRGCLSVLGDTTAGTPRGPGAAHVATCADCQEFFSAGNELELALKRDAAREWRDAPTGLEQQILRAVDRAAPAPAARGSRTGWLSLAGATACAVVAALVYQQQTQPIALPATAPARATAVASTADPAMVTVARQIVAAVPTDLFVQMQPQAEALLRQDPLQNEVDAVKSDARTAVRFLARNFLPAPADEPSRGE